jgi:UDP-glucose 4-epimerase
MKILVTGGAGFIGGYLCEALTTKGYNVVAIDNMANANINNVRNLLNKPNFRLVIGDVGDIDLLRRVTRNVDAVFHLAAQIHIDRSIMYPEATFEINTMGTLNLLKIAVENDIKRFIYASTSEVYGTGQIIPMDENHPLNPASPYAASKLAADRLCFAYYNTFNLNVTIARMFNTFGPRQKDSGYASVIPLFIKRVLQNKPPIVYGDGKQTRDYLYIKDAVTAYLKILESDGFVGQTVNVGTGNEITINDLANLIIKLSGRENIEIVHSSPRPGEVKRLCADITRMQRICDWKPEYTTERAIVEFIEWYQTYQEDVWLDDTSKFFNPKSNNHHL